MAETSALQMLLKYAQLDSTDEASEEHARAVEIVGLCGCLPLSLSIAGGMVAASGSAFTTRLVEMLKVDLGKGLTDETGVSLEDRIIASSLRMIKASLSNAALIEAIFNQVGAPPYRARWSGVS